MILRSCCLVGDRPLAFPRIWSPSYASLYSPIPSLATTPTLFLYTPPLCIHYFPPSFDCGFGGNNSIMYASLLTSDQKETMLPTLKGTASALRTNKLGNQAAPKVNWENTAFYPNIPLTYTEDEAEPRCILGRDQPS